MQKRLLPERVKQVEELIEQTLRVEELVEQKTDKYLHSTKEGFKLECPFHEDEDPSLMINTEMQRWHCFSCGRRGGYITMYQELLKLNEKNANYYTILERILRESLSHRVDYISVYVKEREDINSPIEIREKAKPKIIKLESVASLRRKRTFKTVDEIIDFCYDVQRGLEFSHLKLKGATEENLSLEDLM